MMRHSRHARRSCLPLVLAGLALAFASGAKVEANGTIDTSDSTLAAGTAPQQGSVTIDPCVVGGPAPAMPALGTLGTLGTMAGAVPAFPGGGTGADGEFHATADATLPGGT